MSRPDNCGINEWHTPPTATIDIFFVHGLVGHRDKTWTAQHSPRPWPQALLPGKLPEARLLSYGYNASIDGISASHRDTITTAAECLLHCIQSIRLTSPNRPIILVAHSLGGIVCKKAIVLSHQRSSHDAMGTVASSLVGVIFLGTPHTGSDFSDAAGRLLESVRWLRSANKNLLAALQGDSDFAAEVEIEFQDACQSIRQSSSPHGMQIFCFSEALPMQSSKTCIVPHMAAIYPQHLHSDIDADHMSMVRFLSEDATGFTEFCNALRIFVSSTHTANAQSPTPSRPDSPTVFIGHPEPRSDSPDLDDQPFQQQFRQPLRRESLPVLIRRPTIPANPSTGSYYLPFRRNPNFVGRDSTVCELQKLLFDEEYQTVALCGLGGVGKTQVANALAHWVKQNMTEYSVFWVPVLSSGSFQKAYEAIAAKLNIEGHNIKQVVCDYLSSDDAGPWLMILDNADDPQLVCGSDGSEGLREFLPSSDNGRVLVTTRTMSVARSLASDTLVLEEFDLPDAKALATKLLKRRLPKTEEDERVLDELLRELVCLPLAITQAMAYLNVSGLSPKAYLTKLRLTEVTRLDLLSKEAQDSTRYKESRNAIAATWLVSFDHLQSKSPDAVSLLAFLSQVQPKAIPLSLLPKFGSDSGTMNVVMDLCEYSFVTMQSDEMLDMHSLVHMAARSWFKKSGRAQETADAAMEHLCAITPRAGNELRYTRRSFLPHALYMMHNRGVVDSAVSLDLFCLVGHFLFSEGRYLEAQQGFEPCMEWANANMAEDDHRRLHLEMLCATIYLAQEQPQKAIVLLEREVKATQSLPELDETRVKAQCSLALAFTAAGEFQKGLDLLTHIVKVQEALPEEDLSRSSSILCLGFLYNQVKKFDKAIKLLEHVVLEVPDSFPVEHPFSFASRQELVEAYHVAGEYDKADGILDGIAKDNPVHLYEAFQVALLYEVRANFPRAKALAEQIVQLPSDVRNEAILFLRTPFTFPPADKYYDVSEYDGVNPCLDLFEHVVKVCECLPEDDKFRLMAQSNLASLYYKALELKKALGLYEKVLAVRKHLPKDDLNRLVVEERLSTVYSLVGQHRRGMRLSQHVLDVLKEYSEKYVNLGIVDNVDMGVLEKDLEDRIKRFAELAREEQDDEQLDTDLDSAVHTQS